MIGNTSFSFDIELEGLYMMVNIYIVRYKSLLVLNIF